MKKLTDCFYKLIDPSEYFYYNTLLDRCFDFKSTLNEEQITDDEYLEEEFNFLDTYQFNIINIEQEVLTKNENTKY